MKFRSIAALFLASAILELCAAGCADSGNPVSGKSSDVDSAQAESETLGERFQVREDVPDTKYDGAEFRTLVRDSDYWVKDFFVDEISGDTVDDAVYNRNKTIEERFDIKFTYKRSSNNDYETDAIKIVSSGDDVFELILPHGRVGLIYAREHILTDWSGLTYIDLSKPWWSQKASQEFTILGKLYFTTGSLSYLSLDSCQAFYFNKAIFSDSGLGSPYQYVYDGSWTFEKMAGIAKNLKADLNGDGEINYDDDQLGYISDMWVGPINVLFAQSGHIVTKDADGNIVLDYYNDKTVTIFERFFELADDDSAFVSSGQQLVKTLTETFGEGRAALFEYGVGAMRSMRGYETDFGVLPSPKYDENQEEYLTVFGAGNHVFCVPVTIKDPDFVSAVMEAWAAEAYRYTIPAYYDVALQTKYSRDEESAAMLDIIMEGGVVDIVYFSNGISSFSNAGLSLLEGKHDFASYYKSNSKSTERELEKLMKDFE